MKLFLNLDQMKTVRNALYAHKRGIEKEVKEKNPVEVVRDLCEAEMQEIDRLTNFLNEEIKKEEGY